MSHDVFISYSHNDKAVADAACANLEARGIRCWYAPRDIMPGADWAASIIDAIKTTKVMVLVFTDFSNSSPQVMREINKAVASGVTIVPFKLTRAAPSDAMEYYLSTVHWLDALDRPLGESVEELCSYVGAILASRQATVAPARTSASASTVFTAAQTVPTTPPVKPKLPGWLPITLCAVAGIVAGIVFTLVSGRMGQTTQQAVDVTQTTVAETNEEAGDTGSGEAQGSDAPLETIAVPTNGSAQIEDPSNTGTQGNYQGNYQSGGIAASDGEWFYYRASDGCLWKMRLDGSEKTQLNDVETTYIGVIDGNIYYCVVGSTGLAESICRMGVDGGKVTTLYSGILQYMSIVDGRIYFKNCTDGLKLYSIGIDGTDLRCEGETVDLYCLTFWGGRMYWQNDGDGGCLYSANYDGSDAAKLTEDPVDFVTAADGWILYNSRGDHYLHLLNVETLEDHKVGSFGIYDGVISPYGIVGESSADSLHLYRMELGAAAGELLTNYQVDEISVCEGYIFFVNEEDGNVYMMDIYGDNLTKL